MSHSKIENKNDTNSYYTHDLEALQNIPNYHAWIMDYFCPYISGQGTEFGAGMGAYSKKILPLLDGLNLVEPSSNLIKILQEQFAENYKVSVVASPLEDCIGTLNDQSQDTVILINVLEHIENDSAALNQIFRVLRPNGHLLLFVPALEFLFSDMDRVLGHYRRYHQPNLCELIQQSGFKIVKSRYFDWLGVLPWFLVNTLGRQTKFNRTMVSIYDTIGVPVSRLLEMLIRLPFGKNIILVAQRTAATPNDQKLKGQLNSDDQL
jgi:SAM-dependent methyltransferase